jgi:hypothetical protein
MCYKKTPVNANRRRTKEARTKLIDAKRTLIYSDPLCTTLVVYVPPVNTCTTLAIFVDHVQIFANFIRHHTIKVFHTEYMLVMRAIVFAFMLHVMPWMTEVDMKALVRTLFIPITKVRCLLSEVMMIEYMV